MMAGRWVPARHPVLTTRKGQPHGDPNLKLPEAERAIVDPAKLRDYLLSPSHPVGRFKEAFFRLLGYTAESWQGLEADLRKIAESGEAELWGVTEYGKKYKVNGRLRGPSGRTGYVMTVWIVPHGDEVPRLVTAYPGDQT